MEKNLKSITELRRIAEAGKEPNLGEYVSDDVSGVTTLRGPCRDYCEAFSPSTALALLDDWEKLLEALSHIDETFKNPSDSIQTDYQYVVSHTRLTLAGLKFKKGGVG